MTFLKFILKNYSIIAVVIAVIAVGALVHNYRHPKINTIIVDNTQPPRVDSIYYTDTNVVPKEAYERMNDELTKKIKNLQKDLNIRTKELNEALSMNAILSDSITAQMAVVHDSISGNDSIFINYEDEFTEIHAKGELGNDSIYLTYSVNSSLTIINHYSYKSSKCAFGRWWNRTFKIGEKETTVVKPDNPNLEIKSIQSIKIMDNE